MIEMTFSNTLTDGSENCSKNYDNNKGENLDNKDNANKKKIKAVALLSGGLDSNLVCSYD